MRSVRLPSAKRTMPPRPWVAERDEVRSDLIRNVQDVILDVALTDDRLGGDSVGRQPLAHRVEVRDCVVTLGAQQTFVEDWHAHAAHAVGDEVRRQGRNAQQHEVELAVARQMDGGRQSSLALFRTVEGNQNDTRHHVLPLALGGESRRRPLPGAASLVGRNTPQRFRKHTAPACPAVAIRVSAPHRCRPPTIAY